MTRPLNDFERGLAAAQQAVEAALERRLADRPGGAAPLWRAMRYAATAGGKRLRPFLVLESAALCGAPQSAAINAALAVECVHVFSLIHDDMPCMDDDDMRRGKPTVHKVWDEATAVLAGDALQAMAFEILCEPVGDLSAQARCDLALSLARAAGASGMAGGQMMDIMAETAQTPLTLEQITRLQSLKTGAIIEWSAQAGAILGGGDAAARDALRRYARDLGLAFQIRDDLLDVEGDAAVTGKRVGKDAAAGKATFVSLLGVEAARRQAEALCESAQAALDPFGAAAERLKAAARYTIHRRH